MATTSDPADRRAHRDTGLAPIDWAACDVCEIKQRFNSLIEAGPSVIICLSPDHRILEFNRAAERLYGKQRDAVLGQNFIEQFIPEDGQQAVCAEIQRVLDGYPTQTFENSIHTDNVGERTLLWSVSRILDATGRPTGIIAVGQDISERKQAEKSLRHYEQIAHTSDDLMALVNTEFVYQAVNTTYVEAFGKTPEQLIGHSMAELVGDEFFRIRIKPLLNRCLAGERVGKQHWFDFPKWGHRYIVVHAKPYRHAKGQVTGVVIICRDITAEKQAEQRLIHYQQRLRSLASELALAGQRERRRVAAGLHDQIGQSLAVVKLNMAAALDSELSDKARRSLEESQALLQQSIQATRTLTFELSSAVLQELGLEAALHQLVERCDAENADTRFVFTTDRAAKPLAEDHDLILYDMARELLFNAVKYAKAHSVRLNIKSESDRLQIIIEDDGVGFDTTTLDEGHRLEGGFGYFSIHERLTYIGGELEVKSSIGDGTRVVLAAPVTDTVIPDNPVPVT